jgi:hypothetical protein
MYYLLSIGFKPDTGLSYLAMATALSVFFLYGYFSEVGFPFSSKNKKEHFDLPFSFSQDESPEEEIVIEEVDQTEDWDAICQMAIEQAKRGDHRARDWVVKHMCSDGASTDMNTNSSETSPVENNQGRTEAEEIEKTSPKIIEEAIGAICNLGFKKAEAKKVVNRICNNRVFTNAEELIKAALDRSNV